MSFQPSIPQRPARSQGASAALMQDIPVIPPRPHRRSDRSQSPNRAEFSRSPLNEPPVSMNNGKFHGDGRNLSVSDLPARPPSVSLPSIGDEGTEYASLEAAKREAAILSLEQTRNVPADLPMHAPTASVPQSTAKSRIATVTRTDSSQAAAAGVGKARHDDEREPELLLRANPSENALRARSSEHALRAKASFNRSQQSLHAARPSSMHDPEHIIGIPEIGMQVPMYPNAGDVQAPSPSPFAQTQHQGIGFFNDGSQPSSRNHHRRRSSRQEFGPPGSYGMHGHGFKDEPKDKFEKAWYQRHPEDLAKEQHREYDPGHARGEWVLSSDDLNKLVHGDGGSGVGLGTSPRMVSTPSEQIGYLASEEYASRIASPRPLSTQGSRKRPSSSSQTHGVSPLRKTSFGADETARLRDGTHDHALESEAEDDDIIHIDPPAHPGSKIGGGGYDPPTQDFGPEGGNTEAKGGWVDERGYGVPILASDEIAKRPGAEYMMPAIDPEQERRGSDYYAGSDADHLPSYQSGRRSSSKGANRAGSTHGEPLRRFISQDRHESSGVGTPLEEIEEYEPLFPEDDDKPAKPQTAANKLGRADLARHHFPSQDIWEDTPNSLQLQTTVDTPQLPEDKEVTSAIEPAAVFETPEKEAMRKAGKVPSDGASYLTDSAAQSAKPQFKAGVREEMMRPGMRQRFPSSDIWEDTPDSLRLETTVDSEQSNDSSPVMSPPDAKQRSGLPAVPARPFQRQGDVPQIPQRPGATKEVSPTDRQAPSIPDRPKPQIPARPARDVIGSGLHKVTSVGSVGSDGSSTSTVTSPPQAKAKPAVPSRPAGNKFASLKAGFMNDLNSRLQLGPVAPPKAPEAAEEAAPEEKAPLADARKGRAKGPARRKPVAAESAAGGAAAGAASALSLSIASPRTLFHISEEGELDVPAHHAAILTEKAALSGHTVEAIGAEGDMPEPTISQGALDRQEELQPAFEAALADSAKNAPATSTSTGTDAALPGGLAPSVTAAEIREADAATAISSGSKGVPAVLQAEEAAATTLSESKGEPPAMQSQGVQTGQLDVEVRSPEGESEKFTTYLGGRAEPEGNVVVKADGEEILGQDAHETPRKIGMTGHGM